MAKLFLKLYIDTIVTVALGIAMVIFSISVTTKGCIFFL